MAPTSHTKSCTGPQPGQCREGIWGHKSRKELPVELLSNFGECIFHTHPLTLTLLLHLQPTLHIPTPACVTRFQHPLHTQLHTHVSPSGLRTHPCSHHCNPASQHTPAMGEPEACSRPAGLGADDGACSASRKTEDYRWHHTRLKTQDSRINTGVLAGDVPGTLPAALEVLCIGRLRLLPWAVR